MILALLASAALGASTPTVAPASTERVPVSAPLNKGERRITLVCRTETPTGSRFAARSCYDKADLDRQEEHSQRNLSEMQMKSPLNQ